MPPRPTKTKKYVRLQQKYTKDDDRRGGTPDNECGLKISTQHNTEVVEPFEGQCWVTDASINMTTGMITVPIVVQANLLKCSHCPTPQITARTWQHFEMYIKGLTDFQHCCLFDAIIGDLPV